jgi:hypothetical protein
VMTAILPLPISEYQRPRLCAFSKNHAMKYGFREALILGLLEELLKWYREQGFYEMKISEKELATHLPYIDIGKLRIALQHLINHGVLERFHKKTSHDGTPCYSLCMEFKDI